MDSLGIPFFIVILIAVAGEAVWSHHKKKGVYNTKESLGNLAILIGNNLLKPLSLAWKYLIFHAVAAYQIFSIPTNATTIVLTFFVAEFAYYWYHRLSHELPLLWTLHHTHHSSPWMNLTTAVRLNWLGSFISPVFFLPFVLVGFSPEILAGSLALGLFYQFFLHTEAVGQLGFFEGWLLNTPSAHRVHHGSNEKYIDKNYGGMLIIYDRLFGTYERETEKVKYGVTTGFLSHNPIKTNFLPLIQYLKGNFKREKANKNTKNLRTMKGRKMKAAKIISVVLLLMLFGWNASQAQDRLANLSEEQKTEMRKNMENHIESLQLTEEQRPEFVAISKKYGNQMLALKESDMSKLSKYRKMKSIGKSRNKEMKKLLTKEQYELYVERQEEAREKMIAEHRN
ncbi:MAG: sterol desaturase family protein [Bacteroidota bacterium]